MSEGGRVRFYDCTKTEPVWLDALISRMRIPYLVLRWSTAGYVYMSEVELLGEGLWGSGTKMGNGNLWYKDG